MRRLKIGRSETNEIVIADASVSRHHAELAELGDGRFTLSDLGSTYGTHVWQGDRWIPATGTEIRADTKLRFGEYPATLIEIMSEAQRASFGLVAAPVAAPPVPAVAAVPPVPEAPATAAPVPRPRTAPPAPVPPAEPAPIAAAPVAPAPPSPAAARPAAERAAPKPPPRAAAARSANRRKSLMLGFLGLAIFAGLAGVVVAAILLFGDANPPPRAETPPDAATAAAQSRMLDACTKEWGEVPERRCRCFLAAAGPHLLADDYDDYAEMLEAYVSGDTDRQESALQRATEKRGAPASSRLTAAFKSAVRDCQQ